MIGDTVKLVLELVALFFGITFAIQLFQRRVGADRLQNWMGGSPTVAALKGIAVGFVTPFCTFSAIPMLIGFRQAGVRTAGFVAFIVAAPVLDPVLFGALILIAGFNAALIYAGVAFIAAMMLALVADHIGIERFLKPLAGIDQLAPSDTASTLRAAPVGVGPPTSVIAYDVRDGASDCGVVESKDSWTGWASEVRPAARAATELLRSVAVVLVIGVAVGLAIENLVSPETAATLTGDNSLVAIPIAAVLGTPLYFSTALFVPIADALTATGVGIGAIVALTISGAGASFPEFVLLTKLAQTRLLILFFGYVLAVAVAGGLLAHVIVG